MYFPPYIDATGVHLPTYQDRLDALLSSYRTIFGPEANLEISSPDYQLLSVFARALDDLSQLVVSDYASRNPAYASGMGLDLLLAFAGLTRAGATYSTVLLTLTGTPGAVLPSAPQVLDEAGNIWACQTAGITLDANGSATVEAICTTPGAVSAAAGSVCRLVSPVPGLASAVNGSAATPGQDAESDASCRRRLRLAAAAPEVSPLEALRSALLSIPKVASCLVYENSDDAADDRGIPGHSLCVVASGGASKDIAETIFAKKAPGIGTFGSVAYTVQDGFGESHVIKFQRAQTRPLALSIELKPLAGFDEAVVERIKTAMMNYASGLEIGQSVVVPSLYGYCYACDQGSTPTFSVTLLSASSMGTSSWDVLEAAWNQRFMLQRNMIQVLIRE